MRSGQTVCYCTGDISDISVGTTNPTCLYNSWGGKKSSKFRFLLVRVPQRPIRTKRTWTRENLEEAPTGEAQLNIGERREQRLDSLTSPKSVGCQIQLSCVRFQLGCQNWLPSERKYFCWKKNICRERPGVVRSHSNKTPDRETGKEDCEGVYRNARSVSPPFPLHHVFCVKVCFKMLELLQVYAHHYFSNWKFPESWNSE